MTPLSFREELEEGRFTHPASACRDFNMIPSEEVKDIAINLGIPLPNVEKDHVMGWLLYSIYDNPALVDNLILKGGNCLRKIYFPDTRFSDDLDFTTYRLNSEKEFHRHLNSVCKVVEEKAGIKFDFDKTRVEVKPTPDKDSQALDGRV
ncbi:MAG: nucleotidyl transferase AbiEii/AbiGii toxin family protein, partial [Chloroflexi bacterium]|nr:nucleotidyl transferase AbiEii/AbiGii toxin family protein [Chloroflexota bacterium]